MVNKACTKNAFFQFFPSLPLTGVIPLFPAQVVSGQAGTQTECGDIIEGEFTQNAEEHFYLLAMSPKESFEVTLEPAGDDLQTLIGIYGPTDVRIGLSGEIAGWFTLVSKTPKLASGTLSSTGVYKIRVTNTAVLTNKMLADDKLQQSPVYLGGVGAYTLFIRCTNSDGKITEPGENATSTDSQSTTTEPVVIQGDSTNVLSFLQVGQTYEIAFGSQTKIVKLVELRNDGWAKVEVESRVGWLNINQVALIIPIN